MDKLINWLRQKTLISCQHYTVGGNWFCFHHDLTDIGFKLQINTNPLKHLVLECRFLGFEIDIGVGP